MPDNFFGLAVFIVSVITCTVGFPVGRKLRLSCFSKCLDPTTALDCKEDKAVPVRRGSELVERKWDTVILQLSLPPYSKKIPISISNDNLIHAAVRDSRWMLFVHIFPPVHDKTYFPGDIVQYISQIYSQVWDEMVQMKHLNLSCFVFSHCLSLPESSINKALIKRLYLRPNLDAILSSVESESSSKFFAHMEGMLRISDDNVSLQSVNEFRSLQGLKPVEINVLPSIDPKLIESNSNFIYFFDEEGSSLPTFKTIALGGTFDRIHNGHRKLLTLALLACTERLVVGVTGDLMLTHKSNAAAIAPVSERIRNVYSFLNEISSMLKPIHSEVDVNTTNHKDMPACSSIFLDVVSIEDPFGPTISDPSIDAIVVSSETLSGALKINEIRLSKNYKQLAILISRRSDAAILSSTFIRNFSE